MNPELIYSAQWTGFLKGRRYANPRYFVDPLRDVTSVIIVGHYPEIKEAYEMADPSLTVVEVADPEALDEYLASRDKSFKKAASAKADGPKAQEKPKESVKEPDAAKPAPKPENDQAAPSDAVRETQRAVIIPENWKDEVWPRLRSLAAQVSDDPVRNRDDAEAAIAAELERRARGE